MIIGQFTKDGDRYCGDLVSFALKVAGMTISPVTAKEGASSPDFIVEAVTAEGQPYELGAAWRETSSAGRPYLSITLDSPTLAAPIHCALTRLPEGGAYTLVWSRRKKKANDADESVAF